MLTSKGQEVTSIVDEFINAYKGVREASDDGKALFDYYLLMEKEAVTPDKVRQMVREMPPTGLNIVELPLFKHLKFKCTETCMAWFGIMVGGIDSCVTTCIGMFAAYFYRTHTQTEVMTLEWIGEQVGKGKLLPWKEIMPWALCSQTKDRKSVFESLPLEEFYQFDNSGK